MPLSSSPVCLHRSIGHYINLYTGGQQACTAGTRDGLYVAQNNFPKYKCQYLDTNMDLPLARTGERSAAKTQFCWRISTAAVSKERIGELPDPAAGSEARGEPGRGSPSRPRARRRRRERWPAGRRRALRCAAGGRRRTATGSRSADRPVQRPVSGPARCQQTRQARHGAGRAIQTRHQRATGVRRSTADYGCLPATAAGLLSGERRGYLARADAGGARHPPPDAAERRLRRRLRRPGAATAAPRPADRTGDRGHRQPPPGDRGRRRPREPEPELGGVAAELSALRERYLRATDAAEAVSGVCGLPAVCELLHRGALPAAGVLGRRLRHLPGGGAAGDLRAPPTQSREHSLTGTGTDGTRTRLTGQTTETTAQTKLLVTKCVTNFDMKSSF